MDVRPIEVGAALYAALRSQFSRYIWSLNG